jgi:NADPH-dependent 2,4-dienoyl-CoA reductase/sulfur reductase-like enzyme
VILATGSVERPFPIPGWTLPGVMTLGAAQSLLKTSALVPSGRTVIAGTGPFLWRAASQLLAAGASIDAVLETTPHENRTRALPHLPGFLFSPYLRRAMRLLLAVRGRVAMVPGVTDLRASGAERIENISYRTADGGGRMLAADTLLLHQGVVPETHLAMAAGVAHQWDPLKLCWAPVVDANGGTSVPGVLIAGDAAGIGGAQAAAWRGVQAAIAVVESMQTGKKLRHAKLARTAIAQFARGRKFVDTLYKPGLRFRVPSDDTIACRCEEVTAGEIRAAVDEGCVGPNQVKAFTRCGMGPCQGRMCGLTVTEIIAERRGVAPSEVGYLAARFPAKPVTLAEIAALPYGPSALDAVVR